MDHSASSQELCLRFSMRGHLQLKSGGDSSNKIKNVRSQRTESLEDKEKFYCFLNPEVLPLRGKKKLTAGVGN